MGNNSPSARRHRALKLLAHLWQYKTYGPLVGPKEAHQPEHRWPPMRLCCMTRHYGVVCPDDTFMCCLCFDKIPVADAFVQADGTRIDACQACGPQTQPAPT